MKNNSRQKHDPPPPYTENQNSDSPISVTVSSGLSQFPPPYSDIGSSIVLQPVSPVQVHTQAPFVPQSPDTIHYSSSFGANPLPMICPMCHENIETKIQYEPNQLTHFAAIMICCLGGLCCMFVPYCLHSCQDLKHYCPNCGEFIGTFAI